MSAMKPDKRLLRQARPVRLPLALAVFLGMGSGVLLVAQAWLLSRTIDAVFIGGAGLTDVRPLLWRLFGVLVARALLLWGSEVAAGYVAGRVKHDLRVRLFRHLFALGPAFMAGERTGDLSVTLTGGVEGLDAYFRQYIPRLALAALVPLAILLIVFPVDLLSGVVLLVTAPLIPIFMILIGDQAGAVSRRRWKTLSRLSAHFLDVMQGLPTLKVFGLSRRQLETIERVSERFRRTTMGVLRVAFLSALALELIGTISTAVVAVEIGLRLLYGRIAFQQALFILILAPEFYLPMRALGASFHAATSGLTAAERIFEVLEMPVVARTPAQGGEIPARLHIRFEEVTLTYADESGERTALDRVTFEVAPGETVALIGASGAGKSSIARLLLRFVEPVGGQITVGGVPLGDLPLEEWRRRIAWVPQSPVLFNASVAENIRLGRPEATPDEVLHAARLARAHEFIAALPQGYSTPIGERGLRLSGGQAQRIALARAFLVDAPLVILDEATAHLDAGTEALIQEAVRQLVRGRSALIIAHRLSTVALADRIIVLENGRVAESGSPEALIAQGGRYSRLLAAYGGRHG